MKKRLMVCGLLVLCVVILKMYSPLRNVVLQMPPPSRLSLLAPRYWPVVGNKNFFTGNQFYAGFSKKKITPPRFSWLAGYYPSRPALFINDDLLVQTLALKDKNGELVVLVSVDLIGLLPDEMAKILSEIPEIDPGRIFISATHTHAGPDTLGLWGPAKGRTPLRTGKNEKYLKFVRLQITDAIRESVGNMKEARIRFGEGKLAGYSEGRQNNSPDETVSVMQVAMRTDKDSAQVVNLVNFALHPDALNSMYVSRDFPYYLGERLKYLTGGETMFFPGAIGGVEPVEKGMNQMTLVRDLGEVLGDEAFLAIQKSIEPQEVPISVKTFRLKAVLQNRGLLKAVEYGIISNFLDKNQSFITSVNSIRIGPAQILTVPGELFPKIWFASKKKMSGNPKFCFGLTNGELGYILDSEDFKSNKHPYHATMSVGPNFGDAIDIALQVIAP